MNDIIIANTLRQYLVILIGEEFRDLPNDYDIIAHHLIDSIALLQLVTFIEEEFKLEFEPHEIIKENLADVNTMTAFVLRKTSNG